MNEQSQISIEVIAPTVDEAVQRGLEQLGLMLDEVEVEILDRGGRGLFGLLGRRQARVRLTVKKPQEEAAAPAPSHPRREAAQPSAPPAREKPAASQPTVTDETLQVVEATVRELLDKLQVRARVSTRYGEAEGNGPAPVMVDIRGRDLSILIGRRAERLNALQFITHLIVGKELGRNVPIIVDVEGYRKRREKQLQRMARRMADQAVRTGRRVVMEPMPANERRIVHIALRDDPRVTTKSIGEEPRRKVTIIPVKKA
ncbi:MAG TPA: protein jag [Anaerolineae bacterium]|nr:protein jag [Anaerolineae bacterium]HID85196.1 protein jag [Anaerolineales bacterium]HIQ08353.1 protein jag [Anaerolineaceae bacterium]